MEKNINGKWCVNDRGRGKIKRTDAERRRLEANWVSCPLRSDSAADDFFPVTMPAHAPKKEMRSSQSWITYTGTNKVDQS